MRQAKFNGKTYEVKPTGKVRCKPAKHYIDLNGYETQTYAERKKQLGMYDENGVLHFTITEDGKIYNGTEFFGSTTIKDTPEPAQVSDTNKKL